MNICNFEELKFNASGTNFLSNMFTQMPNILEKDLAAISFFYYNVLCSGRYVNVRSNYIHSH